MLGLAETDPKPHVSDPHWPVHAHLGNWDWLAPGNGFCLGFCWAPISTAEQRCRAFHRDPSNREGKVKSTQTMGVKFNLKPNAYNQSELLNRPTLPGAPFERNTATPMNEGSIHPGHPFQGPWDKFRRRYPTQTMPS